MHNNLYIWTFAFYTLFPFVAFAQQGNIIELGNNVLDPNQDGFVSTTNTGFSGDGYDVDEFEITMFGIPIFGDGETLKDNQNGQPCGVSDLALDANGFAVYAGLDNSNNLIFRFRVAGNKPSVQSYSVLIDSDEWIGNSDPNANSINPGFEIEVTLIQNFGVYIYDIEGQDKCPSPLIEYPISTHQQKSTSSIESCNNEDYFIDFYIPFSDLVQFFNISLNTKLRYAAVTNISATCALGGAISDIGGVDDTLYDGCYECAILDLIENQCSSEVADLCETCEGFPEGVTDKPNINLPVLVGDDMISGTSEPEADIIMNLYSQGGTFLQSDLVTADLNGNWNSNFFNNPLNFGDSIVVNAIIDGKCASGQNDAGLSFAIVSPNQKPIINGSFLSLTYVENTPPILIAEDFEITDDNSNLLSATVNISSNYETGFDFLAGTNTTNIDLNFNSVEGRLELSGEATTEEYSAIFKTLTFHNTSENPSLEIREVVFTVYDGTNTSQPVRRNILIKEINDPPIIVDPVGTSMDTLFISTKEDVPISFCLMSEDAESNTVFIESIQVQNSNGHVEQTSDLCLNFTPSINYNGLAYIELSICDDGIPSQCIDFIVEVTIEPVNDPPVVYINDMPTDSIFLKTEKNAALNFCLDVRDVDNNNIIVEAIGMLGNSTSTLQFDTGLCFNYLPSLDFVGQEYANIILCDDNEVQACTSITLSFEVIDVNRPPVILADTLYFEVNKNNELAVCIEANDLDNDPLAIHSVLNLENSNGLLSGTLPCLNYQPALNFTGTDLFKVTVCDDVSPSLCDSVIVKINVLNENNPPEVLLNGLVVDTLYFQTKRSTPISFCIDAEDRDGDDVRIESFVINQGAGAISLNSALCSVYNPEINFEGWTWISYELCDDGNPEACTTLAVGIEVLPINNPPKIQVNGQDVDSLFYTTPVNTPFQYCLEVSDFDGDPIHIQNIKPIQPFGTVLPGTADLCMLFTPDNNSLGTDIRRVYVCDDNDTPLCDSVVVSIAILPENRKPEILYNGMKLDTIRVSTLENVPVDFCFEVNDDDLDEVMLSLLYLQKGKGEITKLDVPGYCMRYRPQFAFSGLVYVYAEVCDNGIPSLCENVIIEIEVVDTNNKPRILFNKQDADTVFFETYARTPIHACLDILDPDGDELELLTGTFNPINGSANIDSQNKTCINYSPNDDFSGLEFLNAIVFDNGTPTMYDTAIVQIKVLPLNTAPIILYQNQNVKELNLLALEEQFISLNFTIINREGDILNLNSLQPSIDQGLFDAELTDELVMEYIPKKNTLGKHLISMKVCDDGLPSMCDSVGVNITVLGPNTTPIAQNDDFIFTNTEILTGNLLENDSDPDGDSIYIDIGSIEPPKEGILHIQSDGNFQYQPSTSFEGTVHFEYTLCDFRPDQLCDKAVVNIFISESDQNIQVFEGVSPNGDNYNDFWKIKNIELYPNNRVQLYDRWNNLVYEATGYNNSSVKWEGESNKGISQRALANGTYFYIINPGNGHATISGAIVLKK